MNDQGEKTCPLCAEDMDLTDQQLKPCKCGYEICVWCWHQIMDMAEKDETEGRCPACRTAYDKEKIVATAANCERFVAEVNMEKKTKSQKSKGKTSEGPKQLTSVRVIQRNLVYIVGLPLNLADEDLLQHREYFGQYGKVLKVSMSRTAAGVIQQFPNNSCSVYITYSKEEEAIRCIQNVHQFVLEGKPLRACFGTTKYCHAWLRNLHCSNPDCLYLHEIGSQEDSFTKDEIISAYTRSRVQQVTGAAINMQGRSGNVLPPPVDDYGNNNSASTGKSMVNNASSNNGTVIKESLPNGNSGRSLPAAASWGSRGSDCQLHAASLACSNGPSNLKHESVSSTLAFSSAVAGTTQISKPFVNLGKRTSLNDASLDTNSKCDPEALKSSRSPASMDCQSYLSGHLIAPDGESNSVTLGDQSSSPPDSKGNSDNISMFPHNSTSIGHTREPRTYPETNGPDAADGDMETLCSEMLSMSMGRKFSNEHSSVQMQDNTVCDHVLNKAAGNQEVHEHYADHFRIPVTTETAGRGPALANGVSIPEQECDWISKFDKVVPNTSEVDNDVRSFDIQRLKDQEVGSCSTHLPPLASSLNGFDYRRSHSMQHVEAYGAIGSKAGSLFIDDKISDHSLLHSSSLSKKSNIYHEKLIGSTDAFDLTHMGRLPVDPAYTNGNVASDKGESSIISNILSLDSDMWDDSLTSQNLAKLLGGPDKQSASFKMSSSWKAQNNSQSRFSFARQEESNNQAFEIQPSPNVFGQMPKNHSFSHDLSGNASLYLDKHRMSNGLYPSDYNASENHGSNRSTLSNNYSAVSRAQVSAPPGFSVPSRAPPPGLTSHERVDQAVESLSGNHLLSPSPLLRNSYHSAHPRNSASTSDLEFMDPAILAVGEGRLHGGPSNRALDIGMNFPPQLGAFENEARHHLSMQQRSHSLQQNLRFSDHPGDSFSHLSSSSSYGLSSRLTDQSQLNNTSPFPQLSLQHSRNGLTQNGQWEGWNEVQGVNPRAIAEMLSNDRLGMNKLYNGFEDSKYRITRSGDLYNRTFGM